MKPRKPLKRVALRRPSWEEVIAAETKARAKRKPLPRGKAPKPIGRRGKREQAALSLGKLQVRERSGGFCEGPDVLGVHPHHLHPAQHTHHVLSRGRGGSHDPENLLHVCDPLHRHLHDNPAWALEVGLLRSGARQSPAERIV